MKHQVFFLSLFCFVATSSAMEERSSFLQKRCSKKDNMFLMRTSTRYASRAHSLGLVGDPQNLAKYISAVRHSSMTKKQHICAVLQVWDRELALIERVRQMEQEQEIWDVEDYGPSEKYRKIN